MAYAAASFRTKLREIAIQNIFLLRDPAQTVIFLRTKKKKKNRIEEIVDSFSERLARKRYCKRTVPIKIKNIT